MVRPESSGSGMARGHRDATGAPSTAAWAPSSRAYGPGRRLPKVQPARFAAWTSPPALVSSARSQNAVSNATQAATCRQPIEQPNTSSRTQRFWSRSTRLASVRRPPQLRDFCWRSSSLVPSCSRLDATPCPRAASCFQLDTSQRARAALSLRLGADPTFEAHSCFSPMPTILWKQPAALE
jgi:hypothetical protein